MAKRIQRQILPPARHVHHLVAAVPGSSVREHDGVIAVRQDVRLRQHGIGKIERANRGAFVIYVLLERQDLFLAVFGKQ